MTTVWLLALSLVVVAAATPAWAATCEDQTDPGLCVGFDSRCRINNFNQACYTMDPACSTLGSIACGQRSDCHSANSLCEAGATPGSCGSRTTTSDCTTAGCYWDQWTPDSVPGKCFFSLQEVKLRRACTFWTGYPVLTGDTYTNACSSHGCARAGNVCFLADNGNNDVHSGTTSTTDITLNVISTDVRPDSLRASAQIGIPIGQFFHPSHPTHYVLTLGSQWVSKGVAIPQQACNTVLGSTIVPVLSSSAYGDASGLQSYLTSMISSTSKIAYDGSTISNALKDVIGSYRVAPLGAGTTFANERGNILQSITLGSGGQLVLFNLAWDAEEAIAQCPGAVKTVYTNHTDYAFPLTMTAISAGNDGDSAIQVSTPPITFTKGRFGIIQMSATSSNPIFSSTLNPVDLQGSCPDGQKRRDWTQELTYTRVYANANRIVGLRSLADVSLPPGTNCFGTHAYGVVTPTSCPDDRCITLVHFTTRCFLAPENGEGGNRCEYQLPQNRIADLGSDIPYASNLDYMQSFQVESWSWPIGNVAAAVHVNEYNQKDTITVPLKMTVTGDVDGGAFTFSVRAGFLPTPTSGFNEMIPTDQISAAGSVSTSVKLNYKPFFFNKVATFAIQLSDYAARMTYPLAADVRGSHFVILPLRSDGTVIGDYSIALRFADIEPMLLYSPRDITCATCVQAPGLTGVPGGDIIPVPVPWLVRLMPAVGYAMVTGWNIGDPVNGPANLATRRRLLETLYLNGSSSAIGFLAPEDAARVQLSSMDLGSSGKSGGMVLVLAFAGAAVAVALFSGIFLLAWKGKLSV